jgi:hypothetical protein
LYCITKGNADTDKIVKAFYHYMDNVGCHVSQKNYLVNLEAKISDSDFRSDTDALLRPDINYDIDHAYEIVRNKLITKLK